MTAKNLPDLKRSWIWLCLMITLLLLSGRPTSAAPSDPLSLDKCLEIAFEHNAQLHLASTQFLQAKGQIIQLRAILYPTVNVQAFTTPFVIYVQLQETLYSRATFPQLEIGRLTEEQARINYRQTLDDVIFQVRQTYTTALAAQKRTKLLTELVAEKDKAVVSTQQFFDAGQVQKSVVLNIQVQANLNRQALIQSRLTETQGRIALQNLLGQPLAESISFTGDFSTPPPSNLDTVKLTKEALHDREDLKMLESLQLTAEQQVQVDTKNAYPVLGASSNSATQPSNLAFTSSFNAEANYDEPSTQRNAGNSQLPLSLYATWVVFDGGNVHGVKQSDQASIASRDVALAEMRESIDGEIAGAVAQILTQEERLKVVDAEPSPEELRKHSQLEYEAGKIRQLDRVNLENDILQQQLTRLDAEFQLSLATAALDHALGHGLKIASAPARKP